MTAEEERLLQALEMFDDGVRIMRKNLCRQRSHASEDEIDHALDAWLTERPCDADGVLVPWPRPVRTP